MHELPRRRTRSRPVVAAGGREAGVQVDEDEVEEEVWARRTGRIRRRREATFGGKDVFGFAGGDLGCGYRSSDDDGLCE